MVVMKKMYKVVMKADLIKRLCFHQKTVKLIKSFTLAVFVLLGVSLLAACATLNAPEKPIAAVSFEDYQRETLDNMRTRRSFQLPDKEKELLWNGPQEWRPANIEGKPQKGILFVHGLGDSPWLFHDVAEELVKHGFLVRTVLLPGHGTQPSDLLSTTAEEWQKIVYEQAYALEDDVDGPVYLGGFSTGANLVLEYAYSHSEIAGLMLFSPGFKSFPFDWLAPLVSHIRPWIISPADATIPNQTPVRYMNVPTNGFAQFYRTSKVARRLLTQPYDKPVFMVVAQHDSVLNTDYLLKVFQQRFTNPQSRLVWYGDKPTGLTDTKRTLIREDKIPEQRISQFSHMGLLFSPENPLYGSNGTLRICLNGQGQQEMRSCEKGELVWYSDWGYQEEGRIHARLTFNPYFEWQSSIMVSTFDDTNSQEAIFQNNVIQKTGDQ
ncbi:alpha/beta fold hydrolase [Acinetobacter sp. VNH17]|jgi:esterase/lipase|uniref:Alpha/beta fold hydrolase n=2 Tax=Acinetobacter TaxID=469 RepID=A0AAW8Z2J0_9GAMM|nr:MULTISPECIES: alpha/beta fold hydrolase [Acinetobacter]MCY6413020.1 alpha/beta fold hydrolase [Acinetobacter thutiue]MDN0015128.1 alpha/beta fold hydrolase [Acinetobacter thutiue]MDN8286319.1 alpha/beta fold hydrolase [Acinetobacter baumannii]MDV4314298.1 alpha/beta fold hydrolase [Acinetobacter indicus]